MSFGDITFCFIDFWVITHFSMMLNEDGFIFPQVVSWKVLADLLKIT